MMRAKQNVQARRAVREAQELIEQERTSFWRYPDAAGYDVSFLHEAREAENSVAPSEPEVTLVARGAAHRGPISYGAEDPNKRTRTGFMARVMDSVRMAFGRDDASDYECSRG